MKKDINLNKILKILLAVILLVFIINNNNAYAIALTNKDKQELANYIITINTEQVVANVIKMLQIDLSQQDKEKLYFYFDYRLKDYLYIIGYVESSYNNLDHIYRFDKSYYGINTKYHTIKFLKALTNNSISIINNDLNHLGVNSQVYIAYHIWLYNIFLHSKVNNVNLLDLVSADKVYYFISLFHHPFKVSEIYISKVKNMEYKMEEYISYLNIK